MSKFTSTLAILGLALAGLSIQSPARADMFASASSWTCLSNSGGAAVVSACSASRNDNQITYIAAENVFYGPLRQAGQCLDVQAGRVLFTACNGAKSQVWKLSGGGQLNNEAGQCVAQSGGAVAVRGCPANGTWSNATYRSIMVPGLNVPKGTRLAIRGADLINATTGALVASGGGNLVASGGGNLVASGGGNLVASGGGNVVVGKNAANLVASGGGN